MAEGQRLQRIGRRAKDSVKLRRAIVVLMSAQGQPAPDIAYLLKVTEDDVRDVIHAFNERGFDALHPKWSGGAPRRIDEQTRDWICVIARCDPRFLGRPFSCWSLAKLRDYLIDTGRVSTISVETVRRILHERGVSWQATKTWKASTDPDFTTKMRRVLDLYDHPPADGRVICVDGFGPLNLQPRPGRAWRPQGEPVRLRATYTRDQGVRHMIAALDLGTGRLHYRIRDRRRWREFLSFLKTLRHRLPDQTLHVILDNFSPHKHPEVRAWCEANQVDLVFLPTWRECASTGLLVTRFGRPHRQGHCRLRTRHPTNPRPPRRIRKVPERMGPRGGADGPARWGKSRNQSARLDLGHKSI
ncbi:IS630 family transposase [Micromonospora sp. ALFpr18c]|uniref:IS630 family transposase n=1 Tax=Micromonospora sp. ALFpr18c TaxID=1458665 RepID=UPI001CEDD26E|nr:IS630 family transposase [Micromonospora sp. ALFpr18c]